MITVRRTSWRRLLRPCGCASSAVAPAFLLSLSLVRRHGADPIRGGRRARAPAREARSVGCTTWRSSSRSTGARRSATPTGSAPSRTTSRGRSAPATTSSSWSRRWARRPTTCSGSPRDVSSVHPPARARHARHRRRADLDVAAVHGARGPWRRRRRRSPAARRASSPTPTTRGQDPRHPARAADRGARGGARAGRRGVPGRVDRARRDDARPRRPGTSPPSPSRRRSSASVCEIYTDVTGVFSADPRVVPTARRLVEAELRRDARDLRLGRPGADAALGRVREDHGVPLHVRSSFTWEPGTWIVEEEATMEQAIVSAVTDDTSEAKVTVHGVPDEPGVAARAVHRARRPVDQPRHDRAEHRRRRARGHLVHRRARLTSRRRWRRARRSRPSSARGA